MAKSKFNGQVELDNGMIMRMNFNVIADFQEDTGIDILRNIDSLEGMTLSQIRSFYFHALKKHQPDITYEDAGELVLDYPNALQEVIEAASPAVPANAKPAPAAKKK